MSNEDSTIVIAYALEAALLQIPNGKVTFECDLRNNLLMRRWAENWPVKIGRTTGNNGAPDPFGRLWLARVIKGYRMVRRGDYEGIQCLRCEQVSFHPEDIKQKYCAKCKIFHTDEEVKERALGTGRLIDLT